MKCKETIEKIDKYYENRLRDIEVDGIERHLEKCSSCKKEYEELRKVFDMLSNHPMVIPPKDFTSRIIDKIRPKIKINKTNPIMMKNWGISFIAAGLLLFILNTFIEYDMRNISNYVSKKSLAISSTIVKQFEEMPTLFSDDNRSLKLKKPRNFINR